MLEEPCDEPIPDCDDEPMLDCDEPMLDCCEPICEPDWEEESMPDFDEDDEPICDLDDEPLEEPMLDCCEPMLLDWEEFIPDCDEDPMSALDEEPLEPMPDCDEDEPMLDCEPIDCDASMLLLDEAPPDCALVLMLRLPEYDDPELLLPCFIFDDDESLCLLCCDAPDCCCCWFMFFMLLSLFCPANSALLFIGSALFAGEGIDSEPVCMDGFVFIIDSAFLPYALGFAGFVEARRIKVARFPRILARTTTRGARRALRAANILLKIYSHL